MNNHQTSVLLSRDSFLLSPFFKFTDTDHRVKETPDSIGISQDFYSEGGKQGKVLCDGCGKSSSAK